MKAYCVAKFPLEKNNVCAFPTKWLIGPENSTCRWPHKAEKKAVKNATSPNVDKWKVLPVDVLHDYDTYDEAFSLVEDARFTSDLEIGPTKTNKLTGFLTPPAPPVRAAIPKSLKFTVAEPLGEAVVVDHTELENLGIDLPGIEEEIVIDASNYSQENNDHLIDLRGSVENVKATLREHGEMLEQILNLVTHLGKTSMQDCSVSVTSLEDVFKLPITNLEDFTNLNENLLTTEGKKSLYKFLVGTGGSNLDDAVERTLSKLIADELGSSFSLKGMRGEMELESYSGVITSIKECVRLFPSLALVVSAGNADDKAFCESLSGALKKMYDRDLKRKKKIETLQQVPHY